MIIRLEDKDSYFPICSFLDGLPGNGVFAILLAIKFFAPLELASHFRCTLAYRVHVVIPTGCYSDRSMVRQVVIPTDR